MNIRDTFWLSFKQLNEKRVRTALTILMVVIGVASIVALTSQTEGVSQSIQTSLASLGPTSIIVTSSGGTVFTGADVARLSTLPNVSSATPILTGQATLLINGNTTSATVIGVTTQGLQTLLGGNVTLYQGSIYEDTVSPLTVLGHSLAFSSTTKKQLIQVGQTATLEISSGRSNSKTAIPIGGILESHGTSIISIDTGVIISMPAAEVLLHKSSFNEILIKANNAKNVTVLSNLITTIYGSNARVLDTQQLAATVTSIIGSITTLLLIIAGVSLFVASIGIMNVMLMAVLERTHEVGIMKSVGFKSRNILTIFLFQALIIGFIGGMVGIVAGAGASYSLSFIISYSSSSSTTSTTSASASSSSAGASSFGPPEGGGSFGGSPTGSSSSGLSSLSYSPVISISIIAEAMLVAVAVSAIAGLYPAWRASRMEPIEALRQL